MTVFFVTRPKARAWRFSLTFLWVAIPLAAEPHAYFSSHDDVQRVLRQAIDNCRGSLDAALFVVTSSVLATALREAAQRGVRVRLLLDAKHPPRGLEDPPMGMEIRTLGGRSRSRRGIMHDKFAIFDKERIATGSFNWTNGAEYSNYENALFEDDTEVVEAFEQQFNELWAKASSYHDRRMHGHIFRSVRHG